ncbi:hypothetical protein Ccrd_010354 [Cynara cardunculus var. scolymus]|uniref:BTB/POZ-like protein n=1 Tax=Cynara cardunculus var. scolymus TaxID=59895 RepID=A0A118K6U9_CYNCS|nr:hypothetical protein Ccrd_010354 [Cynara cardunculus var. scolymus]
MCLALFKTLASSTPILPQNISPKISDPFIIRLSKTKTQNTQNLIANLMGTIIRLSKSKTPIPRTSFTSTTSSSISSTNTVNASHEFKITGYESSKGMGVGKYIASESFTVGGHTWAIYFYPDGKSPEDNSTYVSLFIALASDATDVRALFELSLMDQSGKGRHKVHTHFGRVLDAGPYTLKYRGSMGYKRFLRRTVLETSDYLKDDCLLVKCTVGVVKSCTEGPQIFSICSPPSDICQHFGHLLESGELTDVNLEVDGEVFRAHKLVLAARSPVFKAQLFGPMKDNNTESVMQSDGFDYLTQSCPCVITELLEYVARIREHSVTSYGRGTGNDDGSGADGRRVRQRIF